MCYINNQYFVSVKIGGVIISIFGNVKDSKSNIDQLHDFVDITIDGKTLRVLKTKGKNC